MNPFEIDEIVTRVLKASDLDTVRMLATANRHWRRRAKRELKRRPPKLGFSESKQRQRFLRCRMSTRGAVSSVGMLKQSGMLGRCAPLDVLSKICKYGGVVDVAQWLVDTYGDHFADACPAVALYCACAAGNEEMVRWLGARYVVQPADCMVEMAEKGYASALEWQPDTDRRTTGDDSQGFAVLLMESACQGGHEKVVHMLLQEYIQAVAPFREFAGNRILVAAVRSGNLRLLQDVINYFKYSKRHMRNCGGELVRRACERGCSDVARWLINTFDISPIKVFVSHGKRLSWDMLVENDLEDIRFTLDLYNQAQLPKGLSEHHEMLTHACGLGRLAVAKLVAEKLDADLLQSHPYAVTFTFAEASCVDYETAAWILDEALDIIREYPAAYADAMRRACRNGQLRTVQMIAERVGVPDWEAVGSYVRSAMYLDACEADDLPMLRWLLDKFGASKTWVTKHLIKAARTSNSTAVVRWIDECAKI